MITTPAHIGVLKKVNDKLQIFAIEFQRFRRWIPGMFLQLSLTKSSASEPWLDSRAFSIASWGTKDARILMKKEGFFTSRIFEIAENGAEIAVKYPFGNFLLQPGREKVFIAGGTGISVFLSYLDYLNLNPEIEEKVTLLYSYKYLSESFENIYWNKRPKKLELLEAITKEKVSGVVNGRLSIAILEEYLDNLKDKDFFVCGPTGFQNYWRGELSRRKVNFKLEQWINVRGE